MPVEQQPSEQSFGCLCTATDVAGVDQHGYGDVVAGVVANRGGEAVHDAVVAPRQPGLGVGGLPEHAEATGPTFVGSSQVGGGVEVEHFAHRLRLEQRPAEERGGEHGDIAGG